MEYVRSYNWLLKISCRICCHHGGYPCWLLNGSGVGNEFRFQKLFVFVCVCVWWWYHCVTEDWTEDLIILAWPKLPNTSNFGYSAQGFLLFRCYLCSLLDWRFWLLITFFLYWKMVCKHSFGGVWNFLTHKLTEFLKYIWWTRLPYHSRETKWNMFLMWFDVTGLFSFLVSWIALFILVSFELDFQFYSSK